MLKRDTLGQSDNYREAISERNVQTSISSTNFQINQQQQTCHECAKLDLRTKVETNAAYNEYKLMIKARTHEKYTIIVLIFVIICLIWFRHAIVAGINSTLNGHSAGCNGIINNNRKNCLNKFLN